MKRMLIDAAHAEETRVVILDNNRIDDFEVETQGKQQLKGNIYIGHVSRVEPSLQAAFITYGGNRNGFLAFGEVHPQFFALKKGEKEELLEEMAEQAARRRGADRDEDLPESVARAESGSTSFNDITPAGDIAAPLAAPAESTHPDDMSDAEAAAKAAAMADAAESGKEGNSNPRSKGGRGGRGGRNNRSGGGGGDKGGAPRRPKRMESRARPQRAEEQRSPSSEEGSTPPRSGGREGGRERNHDRGDRNGGGRGAPIHRRYRIQDVLKEGQKILVQVVKEERGSKGAALTTYFSLPGRYTVLMPNTPYAGGISRKITDPDERRQLREVYAELDVPDTMGLIIRTAGVGQEISQIKHDYTNLTNLWQHINKEFDTNEDIQCVHEDGSVIIRALRDMMSEDIEEVVISGARAYKMAKDYAKNLMPDAIKLIKQHKEETQLFTDFKVENKLNQLHHTRVTLPSGGYLVINPTEALVSVDINSGRATQERNIEETALKTNLEACEELARQIRLRDLAGLIVVDFIDMEDHRNVRKVEGAMRKVLRKDRARIQTGNISDFGLMEISRQRLRPSFGESHFIACPHCLGSGQIHSDATSALMVLRRLEEDDIRGADRVIVTSSTGLVLWLLNHKRDLIRTLEERYKYQLQFRSDESVAAPDHIIELVRIKADGTETTQTINVVLREQPELPPEKRNYKDGSRRRERDDEGSSERKSAEGNANGNSNGGRDRNRGGDRDRKRDDRPRREDTREAASSSDKSDKAQQPKREAKPPRKEAEAPAPKPKKEPKPAVDKPLAVQKVKAENDDTPVIVAAPRKKFEIKKQADTDAEDAPLAVQKLSSTEGSVEKIPARGAKKSGGGIISRLIGK